MPGVYREKLCPTCGISHRKRGPYCSRSCGNIREHTEETKEKLRESRKEYYETPEGIATRSMISRRNSAMNQGLPFDTPSPDDFAIEIPDVSQIRTLDSNEFSDGYDIWRSDEEF